MLPLQKTISDSLNEPLSKALATNEQALRDVFKDCYDIVFRKILIYSQVQILLVYIDGLVDTKTLENVVLKPWMYEAQPQGLDLQRIGVVLEQQLIAIASTKTVVTLSEAVFGILQANVLVITEGDNHAVLAELKGFDKKAIQEPSQEVTLRGPRDSFTDTLSTNITLLRRRIQSPKLKTLSLEIGTLSNTQVVITYIEGLAKATLVQQVHSRLKKIQIDTILGAGYIEEFIEKHSFTPFPQVQNTERPDIVASSLAEGKVAIFMDGSPFVLIVPMTFWTAFQSPDDYYERFLFAIFNRWLRFVLLLISFFLPSIYVAVTTFHNQLIPTNLLLSVVSAREGVPFPAVIEALLWNSCLKPCGKLESASPDLLALQLASSEL